MKSKVDRNPRFSYVVDDVLYIVGRRELGFVRSVWLRGDYGYGLEWNVWCGNRSNLGLN